MTSPPSAQSQPFWPQGWWRIVDRRVGIVPLPVFVLLLVLIAAFCATGKAPSDILMNIGILAAGGFACAEVGKRLPFLHHVGAAAILATFVPSYLVYAHLLPAPLVASVTAFTKASNFLYLFIAAIIVGSILGMDRRVLIAGFLKIFAPLAAGSMSAMIAGTLLGGALGLGFKHSFFFVVVPIMAGGIGEGAIPLSVGYGLILHQPQGDAFTQVLPSVMLGSLTAILIAGGLNFLGQRHPDLTGEGRLMPGQGDQLQAAVPLQAPTPASIAAAGVTAVTFYLAGALAQTLWHWPAQVTMLVIAVIVKLAQAVSPSLQSGALAVYQFFSTAVTYPLLFAIGVAMTPWDKLISAYSPAVMIVVVVTVATLIGVGFVTGWLMKMYPVDVAIVTACHSGQGGTGDVAILSASNRMALMPFSQIATRIGGAITVTATLIAFAKLH